MRDTSLDHKQLSRFRCQLLQRLMKKMMTSSSSFVVCVTAVLIGQCSELVPVMMILSNQITTQNKPHHTYHH